MKEPIMQHETDELAELTPFSLAETRSESAFKSGNMFVETCAIQTETPMKPWQEAR